MRSPAAKRAIAKEFERTDPEHLIALAGDVAGVYEAFEFIEVGEIGLLIDADRQSSLFDEFRKRFIRLRSSS